MDTDDTTTKIRHLLFELKHAVEEAEKNVGRDHFCDKYRVVQKKFREFDDAASPVCAL